MADLCIWFVDRIFVCGRHDGRGLMVLLICVEVVVMDLGVPARVCWYVAGIGFVLMIFVCGVFLFDLPLK